MNILMIAPQFFPLIGGYETAAIRLSSALITNGNKVQVVTERRYKQWKQDEIIDSVPVHRLFSIYKKGIHQISFNLSLFFFVLIYGWKFDLFHVHKYGESSAVIAFLGKLMRKPVLLKTTSTGSMGIAKSSDKSLFKTIINKSFFLIDAFIATSVTASEEIKALGISSQKVLVIPNGIDENVFRPLSLSEKQSVRGELQINNDSFVCIYCGRLSEAKNPLGLINAWKTVAKEISSAQLLIVGDGELMNDTVALVRTHNLEDTVVFAGMQKFPVDFYQSADLFVLPSHREGLSNALLEALSCGLPVVSTQVSGSIDIVEQNNVGKLVKIGDMKAFSDEIINLYKNKKLREEMRDNARKFTENNVSISSVAQKTEELYHELCRRK